MAGLWDTPSIEALTALALQNLDQFGRYAYAGPWQALKFRAVDRILRANSKSGASKNIQAHYDVGNEFFQLWLDPSMTYSSALFAPGDDDLQRAQYRKYDRILEKVGGGERLLEVGCGWGGFAERAAEQGRHVTGLTISPAQKGYADARLDGRADIQLRDYRDSDGTFDGIVSIEMIEAVGERYWPTFFETLKARLSEGGRAVVQAITVSDHYFPTYRQGSDYIRQHAFPGACCCPKGRSATLPPAPGCSCATPSPSGRTTPAPAAPGWNGWMPRPGGSPAWGMARPSCAAGAITSASVRGRSRWGRPRSCKWNWPMPEPPRRQGPVCPGKTWPERRDRYLMRISPV